MLPNARKLRHAAAAAAMSALASWSAPARADFDFRGVDPVERWVRSMPYACAQRVPAGGYWVGHALDRDSKQFDPIEPWEWVRVRMGSTTTDAPVRIAGSYDPAHRLGAYREYGTDMSNAMAFYEASAPAGGAMRTHDLSGLRLAGNIALGQSVAQVGADIGIAALHPAALDGACAGYSSVSVCSWNAANCACPAHDTFAYRTLGVVLFHRGRAVAFSWDWGPCGFG